VLTGATGLLGSHVAEALAARGERVRALVRAGSDTAFLRGLGVELAAGDLHDPASLRRAVAGADVVYHCAAKVGDWGPWRLFRREIVEATANVLSACAAAGVGRVLHVSSINVYGHPRRRDGRFTEDEPLGQHLWLWDHYCRAKIQAERLCRQYAGAWTVVRPSWTYGPRDRNTLPRVLRALDAGGLRVVGRGDNLLNVVHAADVAEGAVLAASHPDAVGQAYNLGSEGEITQREFYDLLTAALGRPRVTRRVPFRLAFWGGFASEALGRALRRRGPPHLTRYAVALIGRSTRHSTEKARTQLGWRQRVGVREGIRRTLDWHFATTGGRPSAVAAVP
jgi:nucleoside-diphosphate-sugar epimerase